jgi:hypothetical protein
MTSWTLDPVERARYLDGECAPAEAEARRRELADDPAAAERVRRDAAFLGALRRAAPAGTAEAPEILEARVRRALAADRAEGFTAEPAPSFAGRRRFALATAAAVLFAVGGAWLAKGGREGTADDPRVLLAARALRAAASRPVPGEAVETGVACGDPQPVSPHRFPPVAGGELDIASCDTHEARTSVSVLVKEGAPKDVRTLVAVPWDGKSTSTDVGWTRLDDDVVVFDVSLGGVKYYLATRWAEVAGTTSCAACHGPARAGTPERNPHHIFERKR